MSRKSGFTDVPSFEAPDLLTQAPDVLEALGGARSRPHRPVERIVEGGEGRLANEQLRAVHIATIPAGSPNRDCRVPPALGSPVAFCQTGNVPLPRPATHVLWDMDGVLLDTERLYTEATQQVVARYNKTYDWSLKGQMMGRPALDAARHLVTALGLPLSPEAYLRESWAILEGLMPTAAAMPGARALTDALHARRVPQAVATSSPRHLFELKTQTHRDWFARFATVVLGDDPRVARGKPAPDIFLVTAATLGADPADCVVIEDSPAGVAAARAAGMQVVAVPDPALGADRFADANLVVPSLLALDPEDLTRA